MPKGAISNFKRGLCKWPSNSKFYDLVIKFQIVGKIRPRLDEDGYQFNIG